MRPIMLIRFQLRTVRPADGKRLTVDSGPDNCSPTLLCMIKVKIANCTKGMADQVAVDSSLDNSCPTLLCVLLIKTANCRKTVEHLHPPRPRQNNKLLILFLPHF